MLWNSAHNARIMPWKGEPDPYKIWLSEIILQQTRVEQGTEYYERFIKKYPKVALLAAADENEVFKLWEGLGYYSRCKNLIASARHIAFELNGVFPEAYEDILHLKGVGPYTAAAIASFAYNLPYAVLDGNVFRVLSRFFGIDTPIDSNGGKLYFKALAQDLLDKTSPATYNQAMMDFGATVCKPQLPLCPVCPLRKECVALKKGVVNTLPVKEKKLIKTKRFLYYIIATYGDQIYVRKRTHKDIWQNLWEFILIEKDTKISPEEIISSGEFLSAAGKGFTVKNSSGFYKQQLTHQTVEGMFIHVKLKTPLGDKSYTLTGKADLRNLAFPRFITNYFEDVQSF